MAATWITSDWHFGHDRQFIWKARGFSSVEEMNEAIIRNHNAMVKAEDDVYVLGDLMLGNADTGINCIEQLNGKLHIVRGNHDTDSRWAIYKQLPNIVEMDNAIYLNYKKHHFYLSHFPTLTGNLEKESLKQMTLNLFGHTHQKENFYMDMPYLYHCGVDSHACQPVLLDDILSAMYAKVKECRDFLDEEDQNEVGQNVAIPSSNVDKFLPKDEATYLYRLEYCRKCVYDHSECPGATKTGKCPTGHKYKRDPPDGGYYG